MLGGGSREASRRVLPRETVREAARRRAEATEAIVRASYQGDSDTLRKLLRDYTGSLDDAVHSGATALVMASQMGRSACAELLVEAGASVNRSGPGGPTPLLLAAQQLHIDVVRLLLEAGADVNAGLPSTGEHSTGNGMVTTPLLAAYANRGRPGTLEMVQLLSSYSARRCAGISDTLLPWSSGVDRLPVQTWLVESWCWVSPLHHLELVSPPRARALLRAGARIHEKEPSPIPDAVISAFGLPKTSPLLRAQQHPDGPVAGLILRAAQPWSPASHELFPAPARAAACTLLLIGESLAAKVAAHSANVGCHAAFTDVWRSYVMPHAIVRATSRRYGDET